jgi:glycosyltransferase involved in cell wall biosynthesis
MTDLSIIVPVKDERDNLRPLHRQVTQALVSGPRYEVVFVDDGSADGSWGVLAELAAADPRVKVVRLRRNFGQSAALKAGIDWSDGAVVVTMDGDLQNDPRDIPALLAKLDEGYDAVLGLRANRQDRFLVRKLPSWLANLLIRRVTQVPFKDFGCTLRALRRDLAEALPLYGEMHRFVPALAVQYGGRLAQIPVRHHPRTAGRTKYNLTRTVRVLLDLITVKFLYNYLTRPMHVFGTAGLGLIGLGFVSLLATVVMKRTDGIFMTGNPLLLLSALLEVLGVQFISLGLLGEVLTRIYFESQGKSAYTVRSTLNLDEPTPRRKAS